MVIKKQNLRIIKLGIKYIKDFSSKNAKGVSLLDMAITTKKLEIVALLLINGAEIDGHKTSRSPIIEYYLKLSKETGDPTESYKNIQLQMKLAEKQYNAPWQCLPELPFETKKIYLNEPYLREENLPTVKQ